MKLKNITFNFENCEDITIDGKYVGFFKVDKIHTTIQRNACNSIDKTVTAKVFAIELHRDANKERCVPFNEKEMTFDRFVYCDDITSIEFELIENYVEDGQVPKEEYYHYRVNWVGQNEYTNEAQTSYLSNLGHLYIVIAKEKTIEDFFNIKKLNNEKNMSRYFDMLNVGDKHNK